MSMYEKDIEAHILFQIEKTNKLAKVYTQREFDKLNLGITVDQWSLLKIIEESDSLSQKNLAKESMRDPASITRTLDILEKKNFIKRESIPSDKRQHNILLTPDGKEFVDKNMYLIIQLRRKSIAGFTDGELNILQGLLKRIQFNMS